MKDLTSYRKDFPMLKAKMQGKPLIYFDSAATTQKPQCVIDAIVNFYQNQYGTVHRAVYQLAASATSLYQNSRIKAQKFLNASKPEEIIFTRGTTEAINLVASSFGRAFIKPGDQVILSEIEHHSNIVPWQMMCEERKAQLKIIPVNDQGEILLDEFKKLLNRKTKMVAIGHVSNALGTVHPIKEIIHLAHQMGAKVLVDGAQAVAHLPIDVQDLDVDFYAFSGHKIYGPTGIGVLYGKEELLNKMPPSQGGGDMIDKVSFEKTTYAPLPSKFEAGTPMIAEVIGLGAAIDYLNHVGLQNIHRWEQDLLEYATQQLKTIEGVKIIGTAKNKGAIISFIVEGIHPLDIGSLLDAQGIAIRTGHHCSHPTMDRFKVPGTARISFGLYNTREEIDSFISCLKNIIHRLK